jgi:pyruvate dehydrogenase E2 component (dihydrolipoamide acetyltransferase)
MRLSTFLSYDLGLDLRRVGVPYDGFGSCMITNVGTFGLPAAIAPLVPFSRCPIVLTLGAVTEKPVAIDGRVEVRPILPITATLDHRMLDGYQAGELARRFTAVLADPDAELGAPEGGDPP